MPWPCKITTAAKKAFLSSRRAKSSPVPPPPLHSTTLPPTPCKLAGGPLHLRHSEGHDFIFVMPLVAVVDEKQDEGLLKGQTSLTQFGWFPKCASLTIITQRNKK